MAATRDCCQQISREHWLSQAILSQIPDVGIKGLSWCLDEFKNVGTKALASKILCRRHNSSFNDLDSAAAQAFQVIGKAMKHARNIKPNTRRERVYVLDGHALELWSLKALLGLIKSRQLPNKLPFDSDEAAVRLSEGKLIEPLGLYFPAIHSELDGVVIATLTNDETIRGLRFAMEGLTFDCAFDGRGKPHSQAEYRPAIIHLQGKECWSFLFLAWDGLGLGQTVITRRI